MKKSIMFGIAAVAAAGLVSMGCGSTDNQTSGSGGKQGTGGAGTGGAATGGSNGSGGKTGGGGSATGGTGGGTSATGGTSGGGGSTAESCGTTDGTESLNTTFETAGSTKPYELNKWGTWGGATPSLDQTTSGPSGLDCSSGCAKLTVDYKKGTAEYSAGVAVQYFGTTATSTLNLLNETMTAKLALEVKKADGASKDVPITISFIGEDTFTSTSGVDNVWVYDLPGGIAALDAAAGGWHSVSYKIVDAKVPSWKPERTVCASALHDIGIRIQNTAAIDDTNGAVVTLYIQSISVAAGGSSSGSGGAAGSASGGAGGGGATGSSGGSTGSIDGAAGSSSGGTTGGGGDTGGGGAAGAGGDTGSPGGRTGGGRDGGFVGRGG